MVNNPFVKIPWIFNENYAQDTAFPSFDVPIGENMTSDLSTFEVNFDLPFRQPVVSVSGWMDEFDAPYSQRIFINSTTWKLLSMEYPINQTIETNGKTYFFKTNFSKENVSNECVVSTIPSFNTTLLILIFIASPIYISIIEYSAIRYEKGKNRGSIAKPKKRIFSSRISGSQDISISNYWILVI